MTQDAGALLPCPFCGAQGHTLIKGFRYAEASSVKEGAVWCPTCDSRSPLKSWNTRQAASQGSAGGEAVAVKWLNKIVDLIDAEDANDPLDDAINYAKKALAALSHPVKTGGEVETLSGQIAAVYGELDTEDCAMVDREWAKMRGYILPTDGTSTLAQASGDCGTWRSMDTAPKETSVLVVTDTDIVGEARLHENGHWHWAGGDPSDYHDTECRYPRLWQPLPDAPSVPSAEGGPVA